MDLLQQPERSPQTQDLLFEGDYSPLPEDVGFRGPIACNAAGITYRQLDYWARTGLVVPEIRPATGSGTQRLYSFRDILLLKVIKRLIDAGVSLQHRSIPDHWMTATRCGAVPWTSQRTLPLSTSRNSQNGAMKPLRLVVEEPGAEGEDEIVGTEPIASTP